MFSSASDRKIISYLSIFLLFQLGYSLFFYFVIINPLFRMLGDLAAYYFRPDLIFIPGLVISIVILMVRVIIDSYIGWRWTKKDLPLLKIGHWLLSYLVFIGAAGIFFLWRVLEIFLPLHFLYIPEISFFIPGLDWYSTIAVGYNLGILWTAPIMPFSSEFYSFVRINLVGFCFITQFILPISLFYIGVKFAKESIFGQPSKPITDNSQD
ncbi:MAG: hypothetical protein ACFFBD_06160 [Candidatus Hodarchaeota archaeon]